MPDTPALVRVQSTDHVAEITLDHPPVNSLDGPTTAALTEAFQVIAGDRSVRAVVFGARGEVFCAGADIKSRPDPTLMAAYNQEVRALFDAICDCPVPVVAAVNGAALGSGLVVVACSDIVVASDRASFGLPEIDVGLLGGASYAARMVGAPRARRMLITGVRFSASELQRAGVLDLVVEPDDLTSKAHAIAADIATKSPTAVRLAKRSANAIEAMSFRDGYRHEQTYTLQLQEHPDSKEAMAAFREKRPPIFDDGSAV